jgi:Tfp pilus assembly protein PilX
MTAPALRIPSRESGVALVMAILVLLVVSMLAAVVMQNLSTQRKIGGHDMRASRAMSVAEAGMAEATSRLRSGEITLDESRPASVAQIFLTLSGSQPSLGTDSTSFATAQSANGWLTYTTTRRSADALTLAFKRDSSSGAILRYDDTQSPPVNTKTGLAVMQVTSTGTTGQDRAQVRAEVIRQPLHPTLSAALSSGINVTLANAVALCGYRHGAATVFTHGLAGRSGASNCQGDEIGSGDVPGVWTRGTVTNTGGLVSGSPSSLVASQTGFYDGPWEALGMSQAAFTTALGTNTSTPSTYTGFVWMDNNAVLNDGSTNYSIANLNGDGVLYVDGNLTLTGAVTYRGLLWVEGTLTTTATGSIVGGVVVRGRSGGTCSLSGGPAILYSPDAVNGAAAKGLHQIVTLNWREVR